MQSMTTAKAKKKKKLKKYFFFAIVLRPLIIINQRSWLDKQLRRRTVITVLFSTFFSHYFILNVGEEDAEKIKRF